MAYIEGMLPLEETEFPKAYDKDLHMQVKMIHDKWVRFFPQVEYYRLLNAVAPSDNPDFPASERSLPEEVNQGEGGNTNPQPFTAIEIFPRFAGKMGPLPGPNTQFDFLWGESVEQEIQDSGWEQPHGDDDLNATRKAVDQFEGPYQMHAQVRKEPSEKELKKFGFERDRELMVFIPLSFYDAYGIRANPGDYFIWDDTRYLVKQTDRKGWWKNTNVRLYMALACDKLHEGS